MMRAVTDDRLAQRIVLAMIAVLTAQFLYHKALPDGGPSDGDSIDRHAGGRGSRCGRALHRGGPSADDTAPGPDSLSEW